MSGALNLKIRPPIDATKDWALIRLSESICNKGVLPVRAMPTEQVIAEAAAGRVFQIAYHRDFTPWRLVYSKPCQVARNFPTADWATISLDFTDPGQLLLHTCDTGGASSGSPLLLATPTGPEVIGLNVGTYIQSKVETERGKVVRRHKADTVANTGVSALAFATKLDVFRNAVIVTAPHHIRQLQSALKQRGHYDGEINGTFSPALRASIESFERAHGLTVTGLATQALLKRLSAAAAGRTPVRGPG
jgi:protease YdgD